MKKNKSTKNKLNKKILKFLKDYIAVITFFVSGIGLVLNFAFLYLEKSGQTNFQINYYIQKINSEEIKKVGNNTSTIRHMSYPTYNNEINIIFNKYKEELKDYYIIYLVLEQTEKQAAENVVLTLQKQGEADIDNFDIDNIRISEEIEELQINIDGIFNQNEGIKIPVAICEFDENYMNKKECIIEQLTPLSIEYQNKYLFSKRKEKVRDMYVNLVTFENEIVNGRGGI